LSARGSGTVAIMKFKQIYGATYDWKSPFFNILFSISFHKLIMKAAVSNFDSVAII